MACYATVAVELILDPWPQSLLKPHFESVVDNLRVNSKSLVSSEYVIQWMKLLTHTQVKAWIQNQGMEWPCQKDLKLGELHFCSVTTTIFHMIAA